MSLKYSVIGTYGNNRTREVKFYWAGGPINSPEFNKNVQQFLNEFKTELMGGSKTPTGLPKFEYISVEYSIEAPTKSVASNSQFTLTPKAYTYWKSEDRVDAAYYWKHEKELSRTRRRGLVDNCFVMDMTKYTNPNDFWKQMMLQVDKLFKKACSVPEVALFRYK